jgi:GT2 family glycosyltransferase
VLEDTPDQIVVVDNASSDGSAEMVEACFPTVTLLRNRSNQGYGAAANQIVANCTTSSVVLLNSDTRLLPGASQALANYLNGHPEVAIAGPRICSPEGVPQVSCFNYPTPLNILLYLTSLYRLIPFIPGARSRSLRYASHAQPRPVPWVLGAALTIRRDAFEAVDGFDESYFLYFEEVDLCYRLQRAGWQVHFAPVADVVHVGGASTRQQAADATVQYFASLGHFYRRYYSRLQRAELALLVKLLASTWLVRDTLRLPLGGDSGRRALADNRRAWQRLIQGQW